MKKSTKKPAKKKTAKKAKTQPNTAVAIKRDSLVALSKQNAEIADALVKFAVVLRDTSHDVLKASKEGL